MSESDAAGRGRVGVRDVARAAGVSTQTVSRVINEQPNIRPETRDRVLAAIAALGYRVNNAARSLGTRTTRTLGVIASDATLYGPAVGIAALETAHARPGDGSRRRMRMPRPRHPSAKRPTGCSGRGSTASSCWRPTRPRSRRC